jgi:hypothetical protein
MQKINCPECENQFIWTDDQPPRGKCPNESCEWQYDIRKGIGKGLTKRSHTIPQAALTCPECGASLSSNWMDTLSHLRRPDPGVKTAKKTSCGFDSFMVLVLLSLAYHYYY